ncbi:hypothetical protein FHS60_001901 [Alloprevotella rava]|uniref:Uncharacterized protein n=1 Tax=Alloprevotella rava TaxID=671218 RepID=A0A7W5UPJ6_9BACT|nr:hypothetical protein [Alloprevotella rava]
MKSQNNKVKSMFYNISCYKYKKAILFTQDFNIFS